MTSVATDNKRLWSVLRSLLLYRKRKTTQSKQHDHRRSTTLGGGGGGGGGGPWTRNSEGPPNQWWFCGGFILIGGPGPLWTLDIANHVHPFATPLNTIRCNNILCTNYNDNKIIQFSSGSRVIRLENICLIIMDPEQNLIILLLLVICP